MIVPISVNQQAMLEQMRENQALAKWFGFDPLIEFYDLKEYTAALVKDTEKENNNRRRSTRLSRANAKKKGKSSEKPLLVFPFKADEEEFCTAASRLNELKLAREPSSADSGVASIQPQDSDLSEPQPENEKVKGSSRTHYITIREDEIERLAPGEFLNDALVDFWMKW
jgi:Ulp1 family protease